MSLILYGVFIIHIMKLSLHHAGLAAASGALFHSHFFFFIFYTYLNNNKKSFHFLVVNLVNPAHHPGENTAFSLIKAQWIITPARLN